MECTLLTIENAADWAACIPQELFAALYKQKEGLRALGISALGEAQGAVVWEETGGVIRLDSIYIRPYARRLGLARELMKRFLEEAILAAGREITVSYEEQGERCFLTPFLSQCGFLLERVALPVGEVTLRELTEKLLPQLGARREGIRSLHQLSMRERRACATWLEEQLPVSVASYFSEYPASFVDMQEGKIRGILLLSGTETELSLDYCWIQQECPIVLAKLLACAIEQISTKWKADTVVRMALSTPQAQTLYGRLFGQPEGTAYYCSGTYLCE